MNPSPSPPGIRLLVAMLAGLIAVSAVASLALWCIAADPLASQDDATLFLWAVDLQGWWADGAAGGVPPNVRGAPYPPLLPLLAGAAFQATGVRTPGLAEALGAVALLPLCLSTAWLAWCTHPRRNRGVAALAAAALAPLPLWSLGHPGSFHLDLPLGALVGATVCCGTVAVVRGRVLAAVLAGLLGALALGVKWTALFFLAPALVVGALRRPGPAAIAAAAAAVLAGPWYLEAAPVLVDFLRGNLAGTYAGGSHPLLLAAPFYPSRLFHGVIGTPLLLCLLVGAWHRGPHRVALASLAGGVAVLTLQPYPDERYLLGGLGLLVPAAVWGAARLLGRPGLLAVLVAGLVFSWSWLPLPVPGGSVIAHRDGLRAAGLQAARADLLQPAARWKGRAPDPLRPADPLRLAAAALHQQAAPGPLTVHVVDLVGLSVLERTRVELARARGPRVQVSRPSAREGALRASLVAGKTDAWTPPPALAQRAWVLVNLREADLEAARAGWQRLEAEGRRVVYRGGAARGERPGVVVLWSPPLPRGPG